MIQKPPQLLYLVVFLLCTYLRMHFSVIYLLTNLHLLKNCIKMPLHHNSATYTIQQITDNCKYFFYFFHCLKSQAINAKLYLRNIISSFCTTMFAFCWQICTDCPSFRFALCLFYSFYASLASSFWNSSPEVFHPNISLG